MTVSARDWIILAQCMRVVISQGVSSITVSSNPVYSGEPVTMTCTLNVAGATVVSVSIEAFNETRQEGTLLCDPSDGRTFQNTGEGRFAGYRYTGCERLSIKNPSVSIIASPSWGLDYRCRFEVFFRNTGTVQNVTSASTRLTVRVLPEVPSLYPRLLVFDETENLTLGCNSLHGTPAATIEVVVVQQERQISQQMHGVATVSLSLTGTKKDWHNAEVTCRVQNHYFPNMTALGMIRVNYIAARYDAPVTVNTFSSSQTLNCSDGILSFPKPSYMWWLPGDIYIDDSLPLNTSVVTVPQGHSGFFVCIAINEATAKIALATYQVTNISKNATVLIKWLIPVVCVLVMAAIVVLIVVYKRGYFKRKTSTLRMRNAPQGTCGEPMLSEQRQVEEMKLGAQDPQYQSLTLHTVNEQNYAQIVVRSQVNDSTPYENFHS